MTLVGETAGAPSAPELTPAAFCRSLLATIEAAEGRTRRRKRDQTPDRIGLEVKRTLLERAVTADPAPADFEGWLVEQIVEAPAAGAVRAMCEQVFVEYRMARFQPEMAAWLAQGAPSDDARQPRTDGAGADWPRRRYPARHEDRPGRDAGSPTCPCDLPQG